jgi:hypothetical protein
VNAFKAYTAASRHERATFIVLDESSIRRSIAKKQIIGQFQPIREPDIWREAADYYLLLRSLGVSSKLTLSAWLLRSDNALLLVAMCSVGHIQVGFSSPHLGPLARPLVASRVQVRRRQAGLLLAGDGGLPNSAKVPFRGKLASSTRSMVPRQRCPTVAHL